jgi:hypothetical protein
LYGTAFSSDDKWCRVAPVRQVGMGLTGLCAAQSQALVWELMRWRRRLASTRASAAHKTTPVWAAHVATRYATCPLHRRPDCKARLFRRVSIDLGQHLPVAAHRSGNGPAHLAPLRHGRRANRHSGNDLRAVASHVLRPSPGRVRLPAVERDHSRMRV